MAKEIELSYQLCKQDIYKAMKISGYYKTVGIRRVVENALLGVFAAIFGYSYFAKGDLFNLLMAIICLIFIVVIIVVPNSDMAHKSARMAETKEFKMSVGERKLKIEDGEQSWSLPLDGSCRCKLIENRIIAIMTPEKQLVVLPIAAIPQEQSEEVQARIYGGTEAY